MIKDKRFEKFQESPPLHKSLKIIKKEDLSDNKHIYASITARQNEKGKFDL